MDNLQSITYQTFEQDPVKYRNYEEVRSPCMILCNTADVSLTVQAMYRALVEWPENDRM